MTHGMSEHTALLEAMLEDLHRRHNEGETVVAEIVQVETELAVAQETVVVLV